LSVLPTRKCDLADYDPATNINEIEQRHDLSVTHADAAKGNRPSDQVLVMRAVKVYVAPQTVDATTAVGCSVHALQPQCTSQHPVSAWKLLEQILVDDFAGPPSPDKNGADRTSSADLCLNAMFTGGRSCATALAAKPSSCSRDLKPKNLLGAQKGDYLLPSSVHLKEINAGHRRFESAWRVFR